MNSRFSSSWPHFVINEAEWNKHGRYLEELESLDFCKGLVGKHVRFNDVRDDHYWCGLVKDMRWEDGAHVFDVEEVSRIVTEESGSLEICEINYYELLEFTDIRLSNAVEL